MKNAIIVMEERMNKLTSFPKITTWGFIKALQQGDYKGAPGYFKGDLLFWFSRVRKWWRSE